MPIKINKKIIVILIILVLVIILFFFFKNRGKEEKKVSSGALPTPKIVANYKGKLNINLTLKEDSFNFPTKISLLENTPTDLKESYFRNIAQKLGFQGEPLEVSDVFDGKTYFWKNDNSSLFVFSQKGKIRYSQNLSTTALNKQLSDEALEKIALSFLNDNEIVKEDDLTLSKIGYLEKDEQSEGFKETERGKATTFEISFNYKSAGYELLTPEFVEPIIYLRLGRDGGIQSFQFIDVSSLKKTSKEYLLKNYQEVSGDLGNAVLVSLRGDQFALSDLSEEAVQEINVNKIELAYLYDPGKSTLLQPIYKLIGLAKVAGYNIDFDAILYLPALSLSQP